MCNNNIEVVQSFWFAYICCICCICCICSISIGLLVGIMPGIITLCPFWTCPWLLALFYMYLPTSCGIMPKCCINFIIANYISLKIFANSGFVDITYSLTFFMKSYSSNPYFQYTISLRIKAKSIGIVCTVSWFLGRPSRIFLIWLCFS